jgi:D-beta-D-heptose 7-phosphate kinase/D-beta-D-heptose 1-phosphate adenosyltransferase
VENRLIDIVRSFRQQSVLLVGDLILDRYIYGDAERISPEAPVPILHKQYQEERVGGTGSVAASLVTLGLKVRCAGAVGLDDAGHRIRALLEDLQVGTRGLLSLADRPTTTKTRFVGLAQHRHRQQILRLDDEASHPLSTDDEARLLDVVVRYLPVVDVVCLEDYAKGVISDTLCRRLIDKARELGKAVLVDPARIANYTKYKGASVLTPNRSEFQYAAGLPNADFETVLSASAAFVEALQIDALLVTLDRDGALLTQRGGKPQHITTRARAVYDNTGAGDAVLAMLAAARAAGASWEDATRLANVAGGLEVEKFGCVPITREEVIADLRISDGDGHGKIRTVSELLPELSLRRQRGETVVFTNGCYDLLHPGHVRFLAQCHELGTLVVVGINSDASVRAQGKGDGRPIRTERERAEMLAALENVNYVVIFNDPTPEALIREIHPDVLVKGKDWAERGVVGREYVESYGGRVVLLDLVEGYSTTALIDRIREGSTTS